MTSASILKSLGRFKFAEIETSPEINAWLLQFKDTDRIVAKMMLSNLRFVSRDNYSNWVLAKLNGLSENKKYALYAVRKLESSSLEFWDENGEVCHRPGTALGSEDLVYSLISNKSREKENIFYDHPDIKFLKENRIRDFVLIDDSIGSGFRVANFINAILKSKTVMSWWSFGWIKFHIVSFARSQEGESYIVENIRGSNHGIRKYPKMGKLTFTSNIKYNTAWLEFRWGKQFQTILDMVDNELRVNSFCQRGFGNVMANIVFYHSVPDNLPGVLWCSDSNWQGLFVDRALPSWAVSLLEAKSAISEGNSAVLQSPSSELIHLISLVKRGVRSIGGVAMRLNCDMEYAQRLLNIAKESGFISETIRITNVGANLLIKENVGRNVAKYDRSLYIPEYW